MSELTESEDPQCTYKALYDVHTGDRCQYATDNCHNYEFINYFVMHFCWLKENSLITYSILVI